MNRALDYGYVAALLSVLTFPFFLGTRSVEDALFHVLSTITPGFVLFAFAFGLASSAIKNMKK